MILLTRPGNHAGSAVAVALFGHGLLGRSITESLVHGHGFAARYLPYPWSAVAGDEAARGALGTLRSALDAFFCSGARHEENHCGRGSPRLAFAWFAGRAGPMAPGSEARHEVSHFASILEEFTGRPPGESGARLEAHVVSSAGGLFEGASAVQCATSRASPITPYGRAKAHIEAIVQGADGWSRRCIYRPSSVFGPSHRGCRRGLVTTLLIDGIRRRESVIFASPDALRDYIWAGDIGDYVAQRIVEPSPERDEDATIEYLVSGQPVSILTIKRRIERFLGRPLMARFVPPKSKQNSSDIVFSRALRPALWRTRGVDECIATIAGAYLSGTAGGGARAA